MDFYLKNFKNNNFAKKVYNYLIFINYFTCRFSIKNVANGINEANRTIKKSFKLHF